MHDHEYMSTNQLRAMPVGTLIEVDVEGQGLQQALKTKGDTAASTASSHLAGGRHWDAIASWGPIRVIYEPGQEERLAREDREANERADYFDSIRRPER